MSTKRLSFMLAVLIMGTCSSLWGQATFTTIGPGVSLYDMSDDGSVLVGTDFTGPFRWTQATGIVGIGAKGSPDCSADGSKICAGIDSGGFSQAAYWLGGTNWNPLGGIGGTSGTSMSTAYDISGDGSIVVGLGWVSAGTAHAFTWDATFGMQDLGSIGGSSSRANAISADGSRTVGWDQDSISGWWRAASWDKNGFEELLDPTGAAGDAHGVSSDGTWVVGNNHPTNGDNGWLWSQATGFIDVGCLSGWMWQGRPRDVSDNGAVVVGSCGWFMDDVATIWTESTGIIELKQYLINNGATVPPALHLSYAMAVSPDGTTIIGTAQDATFQSYGFIATIPPIVVQSLDASDDEIKASVGAVIDFNLNTGGTSYANRKYILLGNATGTSPGTAIPNNIILPLNWDSVTNFFITMIGSPVLIDFVGSLDGVGKAKAKLDTLGVLPGGSVGMVFNFAFLLYKPFDFASNPVSITIVP